MATTNDVATKLAADGVGTVGTTIFRGGTRPASSLIPHAAIFVVPRGGTLDTMINGGAQDYSRPSVQVIIRGDVGTYIATQVKATACLTSLHKSTISGYFQVLARTPEPLYLGLDDTEHPMFSVNVELFKIA
jgi:hypothetical protein